MLLCRCWCRYWHTSNATLCFFFGMLLSSQNFFLCKLVFAVCAVSQSEWGFFGSHLSVTAERLNILLSHTTFHRAAGAWLVECSSRLSRISFAFYLSTRNNVWKSYSDLRHARAFSHQSPVTVYMIYLALLYCLFFPLLPWVVTRISDRYCH